MIHNTYFWIIEQFLGDYNREVYGRGFVGKIPLSQKSIALTLAKLEKEGVLKSKKQGNMKYFKLNLENSQIKDIIILAELTKKINFMKKNRKIASLFHKDDRIIGVFGSYARGTQKEDSDLDLFIIGKKIKQDYDKNGALFDVNVSVKYFTEKEFAKLISEDNPLCEEIINNHITIFNAEKFVNIAWRNHYGLN